MLKSLADYRRKKKFILDCKHGKYGIRGMCMYPKKPTYMKSALTQEVWESWLMDTHNITPKNA